MNDRYKFRGISKNIKEWVTGYYFFVPCENKHYMMFDNTNVYSAKELGNVFDYTEIYFETVGQYTGLKDKNGKEIYDGDIVITTFGKKMIVEWLCRNAMFIYREIKDDMSTSLENHVGSYEVEIIGSIHDKELED